MGPATSPSGAWGVDASNPGKLFGNFTTAKADAVLNACDPRLNPPIFEAAFGPSCTYIDMAASCRTAPREAV